jgi:hypothetical protein
MSILKLRHHLETELGRMGSPYYPEKQIVGYLDNISLVTLHAWMKQGLPYHKQGGRAYFLKSEVLEYIRTWNIKIDSRGY